MNIYNIKFNAFSYCDLFTFDDLLGRVCVDFLLSGVGLEDLVEDVDFAGQDERVFGVGRKLDAYLAAHSLFGVVQRPHTTHHSDVAFVGHRDPPSEILFNQIACFIINLLRLF